MQDRSLFVDGQILQTAAFHRGMGKYTVSLLRSLLLINKKTKKYSKVVLILSQNLDSSTSRLEAIKSALTDDISLEIINLPVDISTDIERKYEEAKIVLKDYLISEDCTENTDFLITSPFFVDFPAVFPELEDVGKYSIVYDFTPYKIWHLLKIFPDDIYAKHFEVLTEADHLFTISHAVKDDLINMFGFAPRRVDSIDGGPFKQEAIEERDELKLEKPYIIYPSAPIVHKNNKKAVQAFRRFNKKNGKRFHLYLTSTFSQQAQSELSEGDSTIRFTGNITDAQLAKAYEESAAVFFPSLAEGLGMPVLEGALHGVPVACSNIPVLSELSKDAFYFFDPNDISSMSICLSKAVNKDGWSHKLEAYEQLKKKYTWERTAHTLLGGLGKKAHENKVNFVLHSPDPGQDTPASRLCEMLFSGMGEVVIDISKKRTRVPSFSRFLARMDHQSSRDVVSLLDHRPRRFKRKKKIEIRFAPKVGETRSVYVYAERYTYDNALQLKGWGYSNSLGELLTPKQLFQSILDLTR